MDSLRRQVHQQNNRLLNKIYKLGVHDIFKILNDNIRQPGLLYPAHLYSQLKEKGKIQNKHKLKESTITKPSLQQERKTDRRVKKQMRIMAGVNI